MGYSLQGFEGQSFESFVESKLGLEVPMLKSYLGASSTSSYFPEQSSIRDDDMITWQHALVPTCRRRPRPKISSQKSLPSLPPTKLLARISSSLSIDTNNSFPSPTPSPPQTLLNTPHKSKSQPWKMFHKAKKFFKTRLEPSSSSSISYSSIPSASTNSVFDRTKGQESQESHDDVNEEDTPFWIEHEIRAHTIEQYQTDQELSSEQEIAQQRSSQNSTDEAPVHHQGCDFEDDIQETPKTESDLLVSPHNHLLSSPSHKQEQAKTLPHCFLPAYMPHTVTPRAEKRYGRCTWESYFQYAVDATQVLVGIDVSA